MDMKPVRLQRSRQKGWKMPPGAVYVGRGTVWGNPFRIGEPSGIFYGEMRMVAEGDKPEILVPHMTREMVVSYYYEMARGVLRPEMYPYGHDWMDRFKARFCGCHPMDAIRLSLRGKDLVCWCATTESCHADVLLEIANP